MKSKKQNKTRKNKNLHLAISKKNGKYDIYKLKLTKRNHKIIQNAGIGSCSDCRYNPQINKYDNCEAWCIPEHLGATAYTPIHYAKNAAYGLANKTGQVVGSFFL